MADRIVDDRVFAFVKGNESTTSRDIIAGLAEDGGAVRSAIKKGFERGSLRLDERMRIVT